MNTPTDLHTPLLETADEFFQTLSRIHPACDIRARYGILRNVLNVAVDQRLHDVPAKFSGLYAKIDFLLKRHAATENDLSLHFALNDVRHRLKDLPLLADKELDDCWPTDLRAVATFVALIYGETMPEELRALFPAHTERRQPQRLKRDDGKMVDFFRCTVTRWDDRFFHATREDNGEEVCVDYAEPLPFIPGDWSYIRDLLRKDIAVNVVRPRWADDGKSVKPELLIVDPDYLINVTSVASGFDACGTSYLTDLLRRISPYDQTFHTLLGNFAGQLLDEVAYGKQVSYADSIRAFFRTNTLNFVTCEDLNPTDETERKKKRMEFHAAAQAQKCNIEHILHGTDGSFQSEEVMLEPSFVSDMLGLQGRMDFLSLTFDSVIEQKSGKGQWAPNCPPGRFSGSQPQHMVQLLLYRAWLHYALGRPNEKIDAALLYSRYPDGLDHVGSIPRLLFEAFKLRNKLAWAENDYAEGGIKVLDGLKPEDIFPNARGPLWNNYKRPQLAALLAPIAEASPLERAYYFRFMQFVANEHALSRIGNRTKENAGFAATWNASLNDKLDTGNIYHHLTLEPHTSDDDETTIDSLTLHFNATDPTATTDTDRSNFRVGDIVFVYPYEQGHLPEATRTILFRGTITAQHTDCVKMKLRNAQTSPSVFHFFNRKGMFWAMEHDFMEASYSSLYRGMHAFLSAPQERRDLLLGQRRPQVDPSITLKGHYGSEEFNDLVRHARQARDLYLLIGPPGTGKTSFGMKNILTEELLHEGTQVLLLSYTNRAVDEICSKLVAEDIDFLRLGSDTGCDPFYQPYLLSERAKGARRIDEVEQMIARVRVVCGTTTALNSCISLLRIKRFDLAIVDEASQILEPHIIGLLSAHDEAGNCRIGRFVLIGDEKQLPAVVQQGSDESVVTDPKLQAIGLHDCRLSLFERLLHLYAYDDAGQLRPEVCHLLTHQGRMHRDIADFPNQHFYGGCLDVVPLEHQVAPTRSCPSESTDWMQRMLIEKRVAFVNCLPDPNPDEPDKVNSKEAILTAALVKHAYDLSPETFDTNLTVGVIVPYRNQISTVRSYIDAYGIDALHDITIDTVERYQGSQRDVIIYSFTAKKKYQLQFLTNNEYVDPRDNAVIDRKLNVAMTRARKHLILTGYAPLLSIDATFGNLIRYARERDAYFDDEALPLRG